MRLRLLVVAALGAAALIQIPRSAGASVADPICVTVGPITVAGQTVNQYECLPTA